MGCKQLSSRTLGRWRGHIYRVPMLRCWVLYGQHLSTNGNIWHLPMNRKAEALVTWRDDACQAEESVHRRLAVSGSRSHTCSSTARTAEGLESTHQAVIVGVSWGQSLPSAGAGKSALPRISFSPAQKSSIIPYVVFYLKCVSAISKNQKKNVCPGPFSVAPSLLARQGLNVNDGWKM